MRSIENNSWVYYIFKILSNSTMRGPILIMFMTNHCHMPLSEVYLCEACCVIMLVLLQIPMGILADKWNRVQVVRIGCAVLVMELLTFALATEHIMLWIGNLFWAIGASMISGADSAIIYDSLKLTTTNEQELESKYRNIEGKSGSWAMKISAVLCLFSSFFASIDIRIPVIVDAVFTIGATISTFWFVEPPIHTEVKSKTKIWSEIINNIKTVLNDSQILWIVLFATLIGVSTKLWFFTYNPYFEMVGVELKYYGMIFFTLNIVSAISSYFADKISKRIENMYGIFASIAILTIPMIVMGSVFAKWCVVLVLCQNMVRGYLMPFISNMINKRIEPQNRATVLSVKSTIYQAFEVACMAMFSGLIHYLNLGLALLYLGVVATILGLILTFYYVKLFRK